MRVRRIYVSVPVQCDQNRPTYLQLYSFSTISHFKVALLKRYQADLATERERHLTTARANQTTGLNNGRARNWEPEVEFSPFRALSCRQMTFPFCCQISLICMNKQIKRRLIHNMNNFIGITIRLSLQAIRVSLTASSSSSRKYYRLSSICKFQISNL